MIKDKKAFDTTSNGGYVDDRNRFSVFLQVLARKFWSLIGANVLFLLFNILAIFISFVLSNYIVELLPVALTTNEENMMLTIMLGFPIMIFLMAVPVITVGPFQAGMTYVLRCFSYEKPTFLWHDFIKKSKENFKQGLSISLINLAGIAFLLMDFYLYKQISGTLGNAIMIVAYAILFALLIIVLMMAIYIYPMMVTYKLGIKDLYKNAFLFSISQFIPNLIILIIVFLVTLIPMMIAVSSATYLAVIFVYFYYIIFGFTLPGLIINSFVNPIIDKHLRPDEGKTELAN